jgi:hypothetical protein
MLSGNQISQGTGQGEFASWRNWLEKDHLLTPGLRESYQQTLAAFEQFCLKRGASQTPGSGAGAPAQPTVALAREYVELQRLERALGAVEG